MLWLKTEVGLDDKVFERHECLLELNGLTLFSYGGNDAATAFASESRVPMRMAIKILCLRDLKKEKEFNPLLELNSKQISEFLEGIFARERTKVKMLCEHIIERDIDGLIFYHYKDGKQFESDFDDLNIDGVYFRKAIIMRNYKFKIPSTCSYPLLCDEKIEIEKALSKSLAPETQIMDKKIYDTSVVEKFKADLCLKLSIDEKMKSEGYKSCEFNIIYGSWPHSSNEFKKKNLFFLIHDDEFQEKAKKNHLWREIISNQQQWPEPLSQEPRENVNYQCKLANLLDKTYGLNSFNRTILLVTKNIFESRERCFLTNLSRSPGSPEKFYFALRTFEEYFVFDPEDYSNGFKRQIKEVQMPLGKKIEYSVPEDEKKEYRIQILRNFKKYPEGKYEFGSTFPQPESGGKLFTRCFEFKALISRAKNGRDDRCKLFVKETLRFSAACMNCRKDGTIVFGVTDSKGLTDGKMYKHGQIVGIPDLDSDTRNSFTEALDKRIRISGFFQSELVETASNCISEPRFVEVEKPGETKLLFVIEVDVEPSSQLCKTFYFKVNLRKLDSKETDEYVLLVRNGASTNTLKNEQERTFINLDLQNFIPLRKKFEDEEIRN